MSFESIAKKRTSIRKYSDKKPKIETIMKIIEIGNLAPSPGNLPILKYIITDNQKKIQEISEACRQEFVKQAPYLLVICSVPKEVEVMYDKRAQRYIKQHTGAAIENMLLYIADTGLSACWVGAYSDFTVRNILSVPEEVEIEAILTIGYQSKIDKTEPKRKPNLPKRIYFEKWGNSFLKPFKKIET